MSVYVCANVCDREIERERMIGIEMVSKWENERANERAIDRGKRIFIRILITITHLIWIQIFNNSAIECESGDLLGDRQRTPIRSASAAQNSAPNSLRQRRFGFRIPLYFSNGLIVTSTSIPLNWMMFSNPISNHERSFDAINLNEFSLHLNTASSKYGSH